MRSHGSLKKWNDDRGFGFIASAERNEEIFVHISAFPQGSGRPRLNEVLTFETETGADGKLRAVRVLRPGSSAAVRRSRTAGGSRKTGGLRGAVIGFASLAAIAIYAYGQFDNRQPAALDPPATSAPSAASVAGFQCDGRTMCSQMHSCAEARYFLKHCPGTQMDGNNDGEPCEQQWCK